MCCITPIPKSHGSSDPSNCACTASITISALAKTPGSLVHASMTLGPKYGPSLVPEGCSCAGAIVKAARKRNSNNLPSGSTLIAQSSTIDPLSSSSRSLRAVYQDQPDSATDHRQRLNEKQMQSLEGWKGSSSAHTGAVLLWLTSQTD